MFLRYFWPAMAWTFIILVASGIPGNAIPEILTFWDWLGPDKIVHLLMYGVLTFLLLLAFKKQSTFLLLKNFAVIFALTYGIVLGLVMEVMQQYIFIGRSGNIYDFIANTLGCLAGLVAFNIFLNKKLKSL